MKYRVCLDLIEVFEEGHEGVMLRRVTSPALPVSLANELFEKAAGVTLSEKEPKPQ